MITKLNEERESAPVMWSDSSKFGFVMIQRYGDVKARAGASTG
ncbi:hypothetical protein [Rhodococcus aetherivorans]